MLMLCFTVVLLPFPALAARTARFPRASAAHVPRLPLLALFTAFPCCAAGCPRISMPSKVVFCCRSSRFNALPSAGPGGGNGGEADCMNALVAMRPQVLYAQSQCTHTVHSHRDMHSHGAHIQCTRTETCTVTVHTYSALARTATVSRTRPLSPH